MTEADPGDMTPEAALDYYLNNCCDDLLDRTITVHEHRIERFVRWLSSEEHGDGEIVKMNDVDSLTIHQYLLFRSEKNFEGDEPLHQTIIRSELTTIGSFLDEIFDSDPETVSLTDRISGLKKLL